MKKIKLGDICNINSNSYSETNDEWDFVNYLDTSNITQNEIAEIQQINLESENLPSRAKRKVNFNSIIYSTVRPIQKHFGIIKNQPKNFLVSTGFTVIDVNPEKVDANFLYYWLSRDEITNFLQSIAEQSTTAYPSIKSSDLSNLEIALPPLEVQKQIGAFLYSLDKKISLNKKINVTLEAMAKTLYDYWFVQFDFPDENGNPYKTGGGKMIFNAELRREIPAGWQVFKLSDFGNLKNGINYDKNTIGDTLTKIVNVKDISANKLSVAVESLNNITLPKEQIENYLTNNKDILIARSGIPGAVRILAGKNIPVIYCGFIICLKLFDKSYRNYLLFTLQENYETIATQSAGTIMQNVTQDTLKNIQLLTNSPRINSGDSAINNLCLKI